MLDHTAMFKTKDTLRDKLFHAFFDIRGSLLFPPTDKESKVSPNKGLFSEFLLSVALFLLSSITLRQILSFEVFIEVI